MYEIKYYDSNASAMDTGPRTGMNAPEVGGHWFRSGQVPLAEAERIFTRWTTEPGYYKRCRIVEVGTGTVVRDSLGHIDLVVVM